MGRNKVKKLAEFQFNADAAPVDLGKPLENFVSPLINPDLLELGVEETSCPDIFHSVHQDEIDISSESLILIANDLNPQLRDEFENDEKIIFQEIENSKIGPIPFSDIIDVNISENNIKTVESVKFKIAHSKINQQVKLKVDDKLSSAIELVELAISKMPDDYKDKFKLKSIDKEIFIPRRKLINKSFESIEFVNKLGFRILNLLKFKYPECFYDFPQDENSFVEWFEEKFKGRKKLLDFTVMCAIVAVKLKSIDIELNNYCGIRMGFKDIGCAWTTHQYLMFLNLRTMHINSDRFFNFLKVAFNFNKIYGGKRLYYLEYVAFCALEGDIFFESDHHLFAERVNERWINEKYNVFSDCINNEILRRIKTDIVLLD